MVAYLVGQHVRLREVARGAEAAAQIVHEREVHVDVLVGRAVERADGGTGHAARGGDRVREEDERGLAVPVSLVREHVGPEALRIREHDGKVVGLLVLAGLERLALLRRGCDRGSAASAASEDHARVHTEQQRGNHQDQSAHAATHHHRTRAHAAAVLDVRARPPALPAYHGNLLIGDRCC